jgi:hypothetical protein
MPEGAVFDHGRIEIIKKWGKNEQIGSGSLSSGLSY